MRAKLFRRVSSSSLKVAALCLLLLLGTPWQISAGATTAPTAIFIVARAQVTDPNFEEAIVLVMNNLGPAPVGIIINRPTEVPVSRLFPDIKGLAHVEDKVYFGGPVDFRSVWFLFRATGRPEHAVQAFDGIYLSASSELLLQLLARAKPTEGLRIFVGHAGWAPRQLEQEINNGDWMLEHADPDGIFSRKSEHSWPTPQTPKHST